MLKRDVRNKAVETIWALKDVSFEVKEGEILGIIGRNGAGKSTLLKILSRITKPTEGKAVINGRVGSLLEVGTGFHQELTGRENVYLNGAILGMRKAEIDKKFDEIVAFSEVDKFIDTPVKRYSSGMYVRLAFSVAAHLEAEILLVDEVLAVGDAKFQKKCSGKMGDVAKKGRTVLFVSHNMAAINTLCQTCIVIDKGQIIHRGEAGDAVRFYLSHLNEQNATEKHDGSTHFLVDNTKPIQILQVSLTDSTEQVSSVFDYQDSPTVNIFIALRNPNPDYYALLYIQDVYGNMILLTADDDLSESTIANLEKGTYCYRISLPSRLLKPGLYYLTVSLTQKYKVEKPHDRRDSVLTFEIKDHKSKRGVKNGYRKPALVAPEIPWTLVGDPRVSLKSVGKLKKVSANKK